MASPYMEKLSGSDYLMPKRIEKKNSTHMVLKGLMGINLSSSLCSVVRSLLDL